MPGIRDRGPLATGVGLGVLQKTTKVPTEQTSIFKGPKGSQSGIGDREPMVTGERSKPLKMARAKESQNIN